MYQGLSLSERYINYLESEGGRCYQGRIHLLTYIMRVSTPINGVMLGGLRGRGIGH